MTRYLTEAPSNVELKSDRSAFLSSLDNEKQRGETRAVYVTAAYIDIVVPGADASGNRVIFISDHRRSRAR